MDEEEKTLSEGNGGRRVASRLVKRTVYLDERNIGAPFSRFSKREDSIFGKNVNLFYLSTKFDWIS